MERQPTEDHLTPLTKYRMMGILSSCPECGHELKIYSIPSFIRLVDENGLASYDRGNRPMVETCPCQLARMEQEDALAKALDRQGYINRIIRDAGTSGRLKEATFDNWRHSEAAEDAYAKAVQCAADVAAGNKDCGLILLGPVGNGKSHLAEAIGKRIAQACKTYIFKSMPELLLEIRDSFGKTGVEADLMLMLTRCDLLILDDLGAEKWTEWTEERMYLIIDARYRAEKNIVATSNAVTMPALKKLAGARTYDRLLEMCNYAINNGESQRRRAQAGRGKG